MPMECILTRHNDILTITAIMRFHPQIGSKSTRSIRQPMMDRRQIGSVFKVATSLYTLGALGAGVLGTKLWSAMTTNWSNLVPAPVLVLRLTGIQNESIMRE